MWSSHARGWQGCGLRLALEAAGIAVKVGEEEAGVILNTALTEQGSLSLAVIKFSAAEAALTDADGNALKQEKLFFTVEKDWC